MQIIDKFSVSLDMDRADAEAARGSLATLKGVSQVTLM